MIIKTAPRLLALFYGAPIFGISSYLPGLVSLPGEKEHTLIRLPVFFPHCVSVEQRIALFNVCDLRSGAIKVQIVWHELGSKRFGAGILQGEEEFAISIGDSGLHQIKGSLCGFDQRLCAAFLLPT